MALSKLSQTTTRYYYRDYFSQKRNQFLCPTCERSSAPLENQVNTRCACDTQNRLVDGIVICVRPAGTEWPRLTPEQRVINRTKALMASGKAHGWSHAMMIAGDTLK